MANQIGVKQIKYTNVVKLCYTAVTISLCYADWLAICSKQDWTVSLTNPCSAIAINSQGSTMTRATSTGLCVFYSR